MILFIFFRVGEWDGDLPVLRVGVRDEHSFHHHVRSLPMFMTSGPYRARTAALRISGPIADQFRDG